MKINLAFFSILSQWVGASNISVDLCDGATYGDLLVHIGRVYGPGMPSQLWRRQDNTFARQVGAFQNGVRLEDPAIVLQDGDHIHFVAMIGGG